MAGFFEEPGDTHGHAQVDLQAGMQQGEALWVAGDEHVDGERASIVGSEGAGEQLRVGVDKRVKDVRRNAEGFFDKRSQVGLWRSLLP